MRGMVKGLPVWRPLCAAAFLCVASAVSAAEPEKGSTPPAEDGANASKSDVGGAGKTESEPSGSEASEPEAGTDSDADKPKDGDAEKQPEGEGPSNQGPQAADRKGAAKLKDLTADGFLIRTTVFVPADAVTRQTGRISSDAMVLTLQKETVIAICYYTLRAYVNGRKGLTKIPSCTVYQ